MDDFSHNCDSCKHSSEEDPFHLSPRYKSFLACCLNPPQIAWSEHQQEFVAGLPPVDPDNFCSHWQQRQPEPLPSSNGADDGRVAAVLAEMLGTTPDYELERLRQTGAHHPSAAQALAAMAAGSSSAPTTGETPLTYDDPPETPPAPRFAPDPFDDPLC